MTIESMTTNEKKAFLLLKSLIFSFHGLTDEEKGILEETAHKIDGNDELKWVLDFLSEDIHTAFERARVFFNQTIATYDSEKKLSYLKMAWEANSSKGHITEMEATAMLKLAKDWSVQRELLSMVRK